MTRTGTNLEIAYTVSSSYSGSTLLSMLLNAQPDVASISEFDARGDILKNSNFLCSCGEPIRECSFFTNVERSVRDQGIDFSVERIHEMLKVHGNDVVDRLLFGRLPYVKSRGLERLRDAVVSAVPLVRALEERFFAKNEALMRAIMGEQGASVFLDANKDVYRMLLLARRFDVRPIYLYKNGIAGVYSLVKNASLLGRTRTVEEASHRWFSQQLEISKALDDFEGERLQLSYSDLCNDVDGTLHRVADFLGVAYVSGNGLLSTHHVIGNRMRLSGVTEIREDESWKDKFSSADIEVYRKVYQKYARAIRRVNEELFRSIWH